jgi:hypothetical protein
MSCTSDFNMAAAQGDGDYFSLVLQAKNASVFTISRLKMVKFKFFKKIKLELKDICQTSLSAIVSKKFPSFYEFFKNILFLQTTLYALQPKK